MENTKNKRVGIGQKPRGRQAGRGVSAGKPEKSPAADEGQEQVESEPVLEGQEQDSRGGRLPEENGPEAAPKAKTDENGTVAVLEDPTLEEILSRSIHEDDKKTSIQEDLEGAKRFQEKLEAGQMDWNETQEKARQHLFPNLELRAATPEEMEAFRQQSIGDKILNSGGEEIAAIIFRSSELTGADREMLDSLPPGKIEVIDTLGQQLDGSFNVVLNVREGYIQAIQQEAESNRTTVTGWCSEQFNFFLESWWKPPQSR